MKRIVSALAVAALACGGRQGGSTLALGVTGAERASDGAAVLNVAAGAELVVALVAAGPGAGEATFASSDLPAFASLVGALLRLAPGEPDVGAHAFTVVATAAGRVATLALVVNVASACAPCGAGESCGGAGTPGACGSPRWARWVSAYGTPGNDAVWQLAADASGHVYAVGSSEAELFLREYGPDGTLLLEKRWPATSGSTVSGLAARPDGGVVLTLTPWCVLRPGCSAPDLGAGPGEGHVMAALDASGALLWQQDSGPVDVDLHGARPGFGRVAIGPSGDVAAFGEDAHGSFLALLDPDGNERWRRESGDKQGSGANLLVDASGRITALDWSGWPPWTSTPQPRLVRYDPSGAVLWEVPINPFLASIAAAPDGDVVLVDMESTGSNDPMVLSTYRGTDGALIRQVPISPGPRNAIVAADASRVVVLDGLELVALDHAGRRLSTVALSREVAYVALALVPGGDAFLAGYFSSPTDFSPGPELAPRGLDAFVAGVSR